MANAVTVGTVVRGEKQFQGVFNEMWTVTADAAFDTDVGADAGEEFLLVVSGVALGDMVLGIAPVGADPEPDQFDYSAEVTAANTLSIAVHATALNTPLPTGFKVLVGRPAW